MRGLLGLFCLVLAACAGSPDPTPAPQPVKRIALTFDDAPRGPGPYFSGTARGTALIEALEAADVTGVMFFVTTRGLPEGQGAERIERYVRAGHVLGNHSDSHMWLRRTEADRYIADLDMAELLLRPMAGYRPFYRFPFLDEGGSVEKRDALRAALAERGLANGYVTIDTYDWYMDRLLAEVVRAPGQEFDREGWRDAYVDTLMRSITFYDEMAMRVLGRSPDHVLLLHENDLAALFIGDLIARLRKEGWEIIPAEEAFRDPISQIVPDTLFLGQGRIAAIAHERGDDPADLVHEVEDEAWLRAEFTRRGLLPTSAD